MKIINLIKVWNKNGAVSSNSMSVAANHLISVLNKELEIDGHTEYVKDGSEIFTVLDKHFPSLPDIIIIDGFWIAPDGFTSLNKFYPNIKWVVRMHSRPEFLPEEGGNIMRWVYNYNDIPNVYIAPNSTSLYSALKDLIDSAKLNRLLYLPNLVVVKPTIDIDKKQYKDWYNCEEISIACFGVARPFKNHFRQALCALEIAKSHNKKLNFYINMKADDSRGLNIYTNIVEIFKHEKKNGHKLIILNWSNNYLDIYNNIDLSMQVSLSETFNLVAVDSILAGVPMIGSTDMDWTYYMAQANPTNQNDIHKSAVLALKNVKENVTNNLTTLSRNIYNNLEYWKTFLKGA